LNLFRFNNYSILTEKTKEQNIYLGSQDQGFQKAINDTFRKPLNFTQTASGDFGHLNSTDSGKSIWCSNPNFIGFFNNINTDTAFSHTWNFKDSFDVSLWLPPVISFDSTKAYVIGIYKKGDPDKKSNIIELELKNNKIEWSIGTFNFNIDRRKEEYLSALSISPLNDSLWYAMTNKGNFYYSFDQGNRWNRSSFFNGPGPQEMYGSSIYASKANVNEVYAVGSGYSNAPIFYSKNKGRDWKSISDSLPSTLVYKIDGNEMDSLLFAATELGPFVFSKKEGYWKPLLGANNEKGPDQIYWNIEYLYKSRIARFATFGRGVWDFELEPIKDTTISVSEIKTPENKIDVYPNPCLDYLMLTGTYSNMRYEIYGINGKLVQNGVSIENKIIISDLIAGSYIIKIIGVDKDVNVARFIKLDN